MPLTMFEKLWQAHTILTREDGEALLYIDRHLLHDGSHQGYRMLAECGLEVRRPKQTFASADHYVPSENHRLGPAGMRDAELRVVVEKLDSNSRAHGVTSFGMGDPRQGILHVVGPELGLAQPGMSIVAGDSHTSTHGAVGALAFGIGASEVAHVMATQALWQRKPLTLKLVVEGRLGFGVTAKDVILTIIGRIGAAGATGHVIEYCGSTISAMSMEERMTVCNMSIEAGARAGMIAPDDTTYAYLEGRPYAPRGAMWEKALAAWQSLPSDAGAAFDRVFELSAAEVEPTVTWGTSPEDIAPVMGTVPDPLEEEDVARRTRMIRALDYMGLSPGQRISDIRVDRVFIGSCTNGRLEDLRQVARVVAGRRVVVPTWVVPGSTTVRRQAESEGLDRVFADAGIEWRDSGCSMCVAVNGDRLREGERCASTSNRNFEGRQGKKGLTHLMSPAMAAAAAVTGHIADVRQLGQRG